MEENYKFVDFRRYCPLCIHNDEEESDPYEPCNDCLSEGARIGTQKPINFKESE